MIHGRWKSRYIWFFGLWKIITLLTVILGIAEHLHPEQGTFLLFDYGNGSLLPLKQLPHTADYFIMDEKLKQKN